MYVLCSGGGTVPKGSLQTFTCEISNDTGYNVSWSVSTTGGVDYKNKDLSSPKNGVRTGTVYVQVNGKGTATVSAQDHEDSDSDSVSFNVSTPPPPTPTPTPRPTPTPTPRPSDPTPTPTNTPTPTRTPTPTNTPTPGGLPLAPAPSFTLATNVPKSVYVTWGYNAAVSEYDINYRRKNTSTWTSIIVDGPAESSKESSEPTPTPTPTPTPSGLNPSMWR